MLRVLPPVAIILLLFSSHLGAQTAAAADDRLLGIVDTEPAEGPFVEVDGKFMVPYKHRIPGTDVEFEMIPVPGGTFLFGGSESDPEKRADELPQVTVEVSPMWVGKTEISWGEYHEYMRMYGIFKEFEAAGVRVVNEQNIADAVTAPTELYEPTHTYEFGDEPQQPAVSMTQYAAQQYTKWLSLLTGVQYRLPTEAEWEYACRAGSDTAYHWGNDVEKLDEYAWYFDNTLDSLPDVGTKKPNPFGLHDMHGCAAEWTVNQYSEDGYGWLAEMAAGQGGKVNALQAVQWPTQASPCVVRGGSWQLDAEDLRCSARLASDDEEWKIDDPNFPLSPWWFTADPARGVGFRLFRSLQPLDQETITKFWETGATDAIAAIETRVDEGRGGYGLVDPELPQAIEDAGK